MERDLGDIIDRYTIAKLKAERIGNDENKREYETFSKEIKKEKYRTNILSKIKIDIDDFVKIMYDINSFIWQLESGLKSGKEELKNNIYLLDNENKEVLSKIGLTTILIRNFNHLRVSVKNLINKMVGEGFQDIKKNHLSE